jgi:hypothetical protein
MADYSTRYAAVAPEDRQRIGSEARTLLKELRLDAHTRNDAIARGLKEKGVDVVFTESAPLEGQETDGEHGRTKFQIRDRESGGVKRALFGALARRHLSAAGPEVKPLDVDYFVEICMGVPVDDALSMTK